MTKLIAQASQSLGGEITSIGNFQTNGPEATTTLNNLFTTLFGFFTITAGLAFLVYFLIGGLTWVTAGGDSKKVEQSRTMLINGAIGMIIIVATYAVVWIVGQVLGFDILNPGESLLNLYDGGTTTINAPPGGLNVN